MLKTKPYSEELRLPTYPNLAILARSSSHESDSLQKFTAKSPATNQKDALIRKLCLKIFS
jgi:hypothetical protein